MAVLKNKTQGRYVVIGMAPMQDRSLGIKERGLLFTIMSLPDHWNFSIAGLAKILPDGKESLGRTVQSLEEKGYLTRNQSRSEGGAFGGNVIEVHEVPICGESQKDKGNPGKVVMNTGRNDLMGEYGDGKELRIVAENAYGTDADHVMDNGQNPATDNPATVNCTENGQNPATENPVTVKPATDFPAQYNTNKSNTTGILESINPSRQETYEVIREQVMVRISYDTLIFDYPGSIDTIDLIVEILIMVEDTGQEIIRIGKEEKPVGVVRGQMRKLTMFHIQYVLQGLESAGKIVNPTAYLLTSLYRSVFTMQMHIENHVANDMRGG
ncbi:MAG: helix-turn-helix domain-containing protein [Lachnospiraceae bacterium]|nr:helix-turn-helix domain-containing protein [Lachnospiraceae bacterium]